MSKSYDKLFNNSIKLQNKIIKYSDKCITNTNIDDFNKVFKDRVWIISNNNINNLVYMSELNYKSSLRKTIVTTLLEVGYTKRNSKWLPKVIIAFLDECLQYTLNYDNMTDEHKQKIEQHIEDVYGVKKNRINTQISLFILNRDKGNDRAGLAKYFTKWELFVLRYHNDMDKLNKAINDSKMSDSDVAMIRYIYNV